MKPSKQSRTSQQPRGSNRVNPAPAGERFPLALRAYASGGPPPDGGKRFWKIDAGPSEWAVVFDTETTTDPSQRLRFGSFQVRKGDDLFEAGLFYNADVLKGGELATLRRYAKRHNLSVKTLAEFIEEIFFGVGYDFRANIIGFNLPFDISRLARSYNSARNWKGKGMRGGFTFKLSSHSWRPRVQIRHHSRTLAFIRFAGAVQLASRSGRKRAQVRMRRGYFLDLNTTAAALTGHAHSLESLSDLLGVEHPKGRTTEHGKQLTPRYIAYACRDVAATWECFLKLRRRYDSYRLRRTRLNSIYSGASLGKAYLSEMGIVPWRQVQPNFPPELLGHIMSAYYGGRAEVRLRRTINQVLYCDFTSMYPTVCALMRLWDFVTADGMSWRDSTDDTQVLLQDVTISDLQKPDFWQRMRTIVQVKPEADIFPVRARYENQPQYTIGLNYLTAGFPMWFTLADCIASKLLTGKIPKVARAYTFDPGKPQSTLWPIDLMGNADYRIEPVKDDFYRRLVDLRAEVRAQMKEADASEKAKLDTEQLALKLLANATSYGIFVELNVDERVTKVTLRRYGASDKVDNVTSDKIEEPGTYFHPLLGTLITGAARLMLAIVETRAVKSGLDWAFCDTDSMALVKPPTMPRPEFYARVKSVCDWFKPLNPYSKDTEIFKIEDENRPAQAGSKAAFEPLFCYAVSAKRYVLFNLDRHGAPVVRRASAHGLGHWMPPYDEKNAPISFPKPTVELEDLKRWQHDLWYRIILVARSGRDTTTNPAAHRAFDKPVASSYHATKPSILRWFKTYNASRPYEKQVHPFNFLISFQAHSLAREGDPLAIRERQTPRPKPVAPFDANPREAAKQCFDRETGKPIKVDVLETYREALAQYHLYPENKFLNGQYRDSGPTQRRHVKIEITDLHYIGKEANELEEQVFLGFDPETQPEYGMEAEAYAKLLETVQEFLKAHKLAAVSSATGISTRYLRAMRDGQPNVSPEILKRIENAMPVIAAADAAEREKEQELLDWARAERDRVGLNGLARRLRTDAANLAKTLNGKRALSKPLLREIAKFAHVRLD